MRHTYNIAKMTTLTTGTSDAALGSAVPGYLTFVAAGVHDGDFVSYGIIDGNNKEVGMGQISGGGTTLRRTKIHSSTSGNLKISLSGAAQVYITQVSEDFEKGDYNVVALGAYNDGVTYNDQYDDFPNSSRTPWLRIQELLKSTGFSEPFACVISSNGGAAVISVVDQYGNPYPHGYTYGRSVVFSTTGALPGGIISGKIYHLISTGLTKTQFQISPTNNFFFNTQNHPESPGGQWDDGETPVVVTSGSQSGTIINGVVTHTLRWGGVEKTKLVIPPGNYVYQSAALALFCGHKNLEVDCYGATFNDLTSGEMTFFYGPKWGIYNIANDFVFAWLNTYNQVSAQTVTVKIPSWLNKFRVNQWVLIAGIDTQNLWTNIPPNDISNPPNQHYVDYVQITDLDPVTGTVWISRALRRCYLDSWPIFVPGFDGFPGYFCPPGGGAAIMIGIHPAWDTKRVIRGAHFVSKTGPAGQGAGRDMTWIDCSWTPQPGGQVIAPSSTGSCVYEKCVFYGGMEVDKLMELLRFSKCRWVGQNIGPIFQSSAIELCVAEECDIPLVNGTTKNQIFRYCDIGSIYVGPSGSGVTDALTFEKCRVGAFQRSTTFQMPGGGVPNAQFANMMNIYTFNDGVLSIPVAGAAVNRWAMLGACIHFCDMRGKYDNMGAFKVLNIWMDNSNNFQMLTTLKQLPTGYSTNTSAAASSVFNISTSTVNWSGHTLVTDDELCFYTVGGTLPTGIPLTNSAPDASGRVNSSLVYARNVTAGGFQVATFPGGTPITMSGTSTGTIMVIGKPLQFVRHPCPKLTVRDCTGGSSGSNFAADISNHNGSESEPMFSRCQGTYTGNPDAPAGYVQSMYAWGYIELLEITVIKAFTGSGAFTFTLNAVAWDDNINQTNFSCAINSKITGKRVISKIAANVTGGQSGDAIAAFAGWLSGTITVSVPDFTGGAYADMPIIKVKIKTDQGIHAIDNIAFLSPYPSSNPQSISGPGTGTKQGHQARLCGTDLITFPT